MYSRYWKVVYDVSSRKLGDNDAAKDIVHDIFVDLWNKKESLTIHSTFAGYLYTVLNNRLTDLIRKQTVHSRYEAEAVYRQAVSGSSAHDTVVASELQELIDVEVSKMPHSMQQIFILSRYEHLSLKEIAERLSISPQTVKNQIHNALERLKAKELNL